MDLLSSVLNRFSVNANVFFSGNLCGLSSVDDEHPSYGHLHLLKHGRIRIEDDVGYSCVVDKPSVIYFPRSIRHRIFAEDVQGGDLVCAQINYHDTLTSPLTQALPSVICYELDDGLLGRSAMWLFDEAFSERSGRQPIIDRLCDVFLINVLRKILEDGSMHEGLMAGLAHPQLSRLFAVLHEQPEKDWSVASMGAVCGMSRSKFSSVFREVIGQTPGDYLAGWRISVAKKLLLERQNVDLIANRVGYENGSALARVFRKKEGCSPKEWLATV